MDSRERFLRTARGRPADRVAYLEEPARSEVLERWYEEGLSRCVTEDNYREFFGLDRYDYIYLPLEPARGTLRSREDFESLEEAYRGDRQDFRRPGFWRDKADQYGSRDFPLGVMAWRGFMLPLFTHRREWESFQDVFLALFDYPEQVKSALGLVADCCVEAMDLALRHLDFDFAVVSEPIASRSGPIISPAAFRELVLPCYRKIIDFLHGRGVDLVVFRSICNVKPILPLVVEAGVDGIWVTQTDGVIDYAELRRDYPDVLLIGGIDATVLAGDRDAIRTEVMAKVPTLLAGGRYLPALDDNPRANVPYQNYSYFNKLLREVCEGFRS